jgi:DNA-binding LytR/AlgR family response regulator
MNAPVRCVIADDERLMREQLRARLVEVWPELQIVAEAKNGTQAVQLTETLHPDLVFLDIRMPGMTGIDAARQIAQLPTDDECADAWAGCEIVFITAYDEYAVDAFEQGVVDYVLKPAERERLAVTVERVKKRLLQRANFTSPETGTGTRADSGDDSRSGHNMQKLLKDLSAQLNPNAAPHLRWIQASVGQTIQMIPVEDVLFFISDEKYTRVQTATIEALIRKPIKELVDELDANLFWQVHRSTLVNTRAISGVSRDARGRQLVGVKGHAEKLEVSRSFSALFKGM